MGRFYFLVTAPAARLGRLGRLEEVEPSSRPCAEVGTSATCSGAWRLGGTKNQLVDGVSRRTESATCALPKVCKRIEDGRYELSPLTFQLGGHRHARLTPDRGMH